MLRGIRAAQYPRRPARWKAPRALAAALAAAIATTTLTALLAAGLAAPALATEPPPPTGTGFELEAAEVPEGLAIEMVDRLPYLLGPVGRQRVTCGLVALDTNASRVCTPAALTRHRAVQALGEGFEERVRALAVPRVARAGSVEAISPGCLSRWESWNTSGLASLQTVIGEPNQRSAGEILTDLRALSARTGPLGTRTGPLTMDKVRRYCSFWSNAAPDSVLEEALSFFLSSYGGKKHDPACTKLGTPGYDTIDGLLEHAAEFLVAELGSGSNVAFGIFNQVRHLILDPSYPEDFLGDRLEAPALSAIRSRFPGACPENLPRDERIGAACICAASSVAMAIRPAALADLTPAIEASRARVAEIYERMVGSSALSSGARDALRSMGAPAIRARGGGPSSAVHRFDTEPDGTNSVLDLPYSTVLGLAQEPPDPAALLAVSHEIGHSFFWALGRNRVGDALTPGDRATLTGFTDCLDTSFTRGELRLLEATDDEAPDLSRERNLVVAKRHEYAGDYFARAALRGRAPPVGEADLTASLSMFCSAPGNAAATAWDPIDNAHMDVYRTDGHAEARYRMELFFRPDAAPDLTDCGTLRVCPPVTCDRTLWPPPALPPAIPPPAP